MFAIFDKHAGKPTTDKPFLTEDAAWQAAKDFGLVQQGRMMGNPIELLHNGYCIKEVEDVVEEY